MALWLGLCGPCDGQVVISAWTGGHWLELVKRLQLDCIQWYDQTFGCCLDFNVWMATKLWLEERENQSYNQLHTSFKLSLLKLRRKHPNAVICGLPGASQNWCSWVTDLKAASSRKFLTVSYYLQVIEDLKQGVPSYVTLPLWEYYKLQFPHLPFFMLLVLNSIAYSETICTI